MVENKDLPKLSWIEKKLLEDKELGYISETFKKAGKRYYKINIKDGRKVLIQDRGPHKHDYSVSLFLPPDEREIIKPKTREEYRNDAKDRKWRFTRAIVAGDDIDGVPDLSDFIIIETFKIPETKKEILTKDSDLLEEIKQVNSEVEIDPIEIGEIIDEENSQEIVIPHKIVIKPRKSTKNPISYETLLIEDEMQDEEDPMMIEETHEEHIIGEIELVKEELIEEIPEISPEEIDIKRDIVLEESKIIEEQKLNLVDSLKIDEEINKKLSEIEGPSETPVTNTGFRSLDEMYEDLVANSFNPVGVFSKDPGTNKYQELEWLVKHFFAKGDSNKGAQVKIVRDKYNS